MVKKGFSLAEALIVMAIVAILFACASKVITTKPKQSKQVAPHGYFECYLDGGTLKQHQVRENMMTDSYSVETCLFEPPAGIAFFNINSYSPVAYSDFQPNINVNLTIRVTNSGITIQSPTATLNLYNNDSSQNVRNFFSVLYPDSKVYNNGMIRKGVMISW